MIARAKAWLVLEDGTAYPGRAFGAVHEGAGEVVFHTGLTGYQEILTDPSYKGQIVTMTAPQIGNYGVTPEDCESSAVHVAGFVVRELSARPSNWRSQESLEDYLAGAGIAAIEGVDTRDLTRRLREHGAMRGIIVQGEADLATALEKARAIPQMEGQDLVPSVSCNEPYEWQGTPGIEEDAALSGQPDPAADEHPLSVVVYDFGVKWNILRSLRARGCAVTVVPAQTPPEAVLSNGPGDPATVTYGVTAAEQLMGKLPMLGICLGHQIIGQAAGGRTFKLKFGHHGANHPVRVIATEAVEITSQNHGFAVDSDSLADTGFVTTRVNLNDGTLEGLRHKDLPVLAVQYHPEAAPGPHDAAPLFDAFIEMMRGAPPEVAADA
ncbi:MAG: glutamine-hydrolyzing carbamoyl-phosphate synthase small subunit [Acidobacteriota bacterium]|jgi:carbamoyl-phosphate synthase small subunit